MMFVKSLPVGLALAIAAGGALAQATPAAPSAPAPAAGQPTDSVDAMFQRWDKNSDKVLSLTEFKTGLEERTRAEILARLQAQFKAKDKNNDGALQSTEFNELPLVKTGGSTAPTFAASDSDKDQKLSFKEYVAMIGKYAASKQAAKKP